MNSNPYTAPSADNEIEHKPKKPIDKLALIGVLLFTGPICGTAIQIFALKKALEVALFRDLPWPGFMPHDLRLFLMVGLIGILAGLIGATCMLISLFKIKYRSKWFFYCSLALALVWCLLLKKYGVFIGLPVFIAFMTKQKEFTKST